MAQNSLGEQGLRQPSVQEAATFTVCFQHALIYGIHMVTLPRPQPPQIPQACWRPRLEPGGGGTSARHALFARSLRGPGPGGRAGTWSPIHIPSCRALAALPSYPNYPGKLCQAQAAASTISHRTACPASLGTIYGVVPGQTRQRACKPPGVGWGREWRRAVEGGAGSDPCPWAGGRERGESAPPASPPGAGGPGSCWWKAAGSHLLGGRDGS